MNKPSGPDRRDRDASNRGQREGLQLDRAVLLSYGIGAVFLLLVAAVWFAADVLLLIFAGILFAVLFDDAVQLVQRLVPVRRSYALLLVVVFVLALVALAVWLLAPDVSEQARQLWTRLPAAVHAARAMLQRHEALHGLVSALPDPDQLVGNASRLLIGARSVFSNVLGSLGNSVIVGVVALYLAVRPDVYVDGLLTLVPIQRRPRIRYVLAQIGTTLRYWLRGKLLAMVVVGTVTAIGLVALDVPLGLTLGVLAGLLDFIPYLGPALSAFPAFLLALSNEPVSALYVALLFTAVQVMEGYLLLPIVERKSVALPPALTVTMQVLMGIAFGLLGVALATPLTAVATVLVATLYVQDVLGDDVRLPGDGPNERQQ